MCEQCRYARIEVIDDIVAQARPDQIRRLLRDLRSPDEPRSEGGAE